MVQKKTLELTELGMVRFVSLVVGKRSIQGKAFDRYGKTMGKEKAFRSPSMMIDGWMSAGLE